MRFLPMIGLVIAEIACRENLGTTGAFTFRLNSKKKAFREESLSSI